MIIFCLPSVCDEETQFKCGSYGCIPNSWVCDAEFDCDDLSDERGCASKCHINNINVN